jgi:hypothetical protein
MGKVYLAHDELLGRDVAIKVLAHDLAEQEEFVERFRREAMSAASLSHSNIVAVYDRGESEEGEHYIAMEYVSGVTLKDLIEKEGVLPPARAVSIALGVTRALQAAHTRGIIHRDIKPQNILIDESGEVRVADFGIARALSLSTLTESGFALGSAHYISPEQALGRPTTPRSDLYSLGVVLYEMLTGEVPFDAETPIGVAGQHVNRRLRPPRELNAHVPERLNALIVSLLAKDPEKRPSDAAALAAELERAGRHPAGSSEDRTAPLERSTHQSGPGATRPYAAPQHPPAAYSGSARDRERSRGPFSRYAGAAFAAVGVLVVLLLVGGGIMALTSVGSLESLLGEGGDSPTPPSDAPERPRGSSAPPTASPISPNDPPKTEVSDNESTMRSEEGLRQAVEDYYQAVDREDWGYTYQNLDSQTQAAFDKEEWYLKNQWFADNEGLELATIDVSVDGSASSDPVVGVSVYRTFKDGTSIDRDTFFVYEDGTWKHRLSEVEIGFFMPDTSFEEFVAAQGGSSPSPSASASASATPAAEEDAEGVEDAVRGHYEAIGRGDFEEAYSYFGPTMRSRQGEASWVASERSFEIQSSTIHSLAVDEVLGSTATATVDVSFVDNTGNPRFVIVWGLVKEDGEWKLDEQISAQRSG